jgi:hypothetical protein
MAIYLPTYLSPITAESRDMTQNQIFTSVINGTFATHYQLKIYNNVNNAVLYDSTKITLSPYLYDKQILTHTVPSNSVTNGLELKWTLQVWQNTNTVTSREVYFKSYSNPTFTMTVPSIINSCTYEFIGIYTHPQNINIRRFNFKLYDVNENILSESGDIYTSNTKYVFTDISFANGVSYKVEGLVEDENGIIVSTGIQSFEVSYSPPSLIIVPTAKFDKSTSGVTLNWSKAVQNLCTVNGTVEYVNNFLKTDNHGLHLTKGSDINYSLDIPLDFTCPFILKLETGFEGIICNLSGEGIYIFGYREGCFFTTINGITEYGIKRKIGSNPFLIALRPTNVYIREIVL